jgi:hypothetical protein
MFWKKLSQEVLAGTEGKGSLTVNSQISSGLQMVSWPF